MLLNIAMQTNLPPAKSISSTQDVMDTVLYLSYVDFGTGAILPIDSGSATAVWASQ